ncbi:glycosyl hydrolase, partial [Burkholderia sp. SIMBA_024]|uniref:glycosyl hydrolase n=1 Tax=Burkholderia sp. SIMBA_024 TaxID=3085768 RepID=UPI00397C9F8B
RNTFGQGQIFWGLPLAEVLEQLKIEKDFYYTAEQQDATIHFAHKKIQDSEFYFVSNHKRRKEKVFCSFRVSGLVPELWDSETGEVTTTILYEIKEGRVNITLEFEPAGAYFVVFKKGNSLAKFQSVAKDGQVLLSLKSFDKQADK